MLYEFIKAPIEHLGAEDHVTAAQVRNCLSRLAAHLEPEPAPVPVADPVSETVAAEVATGDETPAS
jgi:hypothetical protein